MPIRQWSKLGADLRASSVAEGHTERARAAAPTRITLEKIKIQGSSRIPLYIAPGVTYTTLTSASSSLWTGPRITRLSAIAFLLWTKGASILIATAIATIAMPITDTLLAAVPTITIWHVET